MSGGPKFSRKGKADDPQDAVSEPDPVAPLETRSQREARLAQETRRAAEAEAARKAEAKRRAQTARAEAMKRLAAEAQAREDAERAKARAAQAQATEKDEARALRLKAKRQAEARRRVAAARAEAARQKAEAERAEAVEEARREAETRAAEEAQAEEVRRVADAREAEVARAEEARQEAEAREAEAAHAQEARQAKKAARDGANAQADDARRAEDAHKAEVALREALSREDDASETHRDNASRNTSAGPIHAQPQPSETAPKAPLDPDALWQSLDTFEVNERHLDRNRIITASRLDPAHSAFDVLRTRLLQALAERGWTRVAITSPTKDCGKTFTAANLAISLSRQENCRTMLLDCDLRQPSLHKVMGAKDPGSMGDMLRGVIPPERQLQRLGRNTINAGSNIAFGFNGIVEPYAAELLQDPRSAQTLRQVEDRFQPDVMLFDLPPALYSDDVIAFRPHFDGVLLVIGGGLTTEKEVREVERRLGEKTPLLGTILNKAEGTKVRKYAY